MFLLPFFSLALLTAASLVQEASPSGDTIERAATLPAADNTDTFIAPEEESISRLGEAHAAVEVHQVVFTVEADSGEPDTERHVKEKERLSQRLKREKGLWRSPHPRYRLLEALYGFRKYLEINTKDLNHWRDLYRHVTPKQKSRLERDIKYTEKFTKIQRVLQENHNLCQHIVDTALSFYGIDETELDQHIKEAEKAGRGADKVSVSQSLKHIVRDWSGSGAGERGDAFPCILKTLERLFPDRDDAVTVLLPGSGLGRLGHEISSLGGFEVTNNEWSMFMNVMYRFLEAHRTRTSNTVHPFADTWSHHATTSDMLRPISFPDRPINATSVVLVEGDFNVVFDHGERFDSIVTHFFIDTARNLITYLDTIYALLQPGGIWLNFGPLLYGSGPYVQLSLEEILIVAEAMGFEFLDIEEEGCGEISLEGWKVRDMEAVYGFDERALTKNAYRAQFWAARRKA